MQTLQLSQYKFRHRDRSDQRVIDIWAGAGARTRAVYRSRQQTPLVSPSATGVAAGRCRCRCRCRQLLLVSRATPPPPTVIIGRSFNQPISRSSTYRHSFRARSGLPGSVSYGGHIEARLSVPGAGRPEPAGSKWVGRGHLSGAVRARLYCMWLEMMDHQHRAVMVKLDRKPGPWGYGSTTGLRWADLGEINNTGVEIECDRSGLTPDR